jgi:hypothetical protein
MQVPESVFAEFLQMIEGGPIAVCEDPWKPTANDGAMISIPKSGLGFRCGIEFDVWQFLSMDISIPTKSLVRFPGESLSAKYLCRLQQRWRFGEKFDQTGQAILP